MFHVCPKCGKPSNSIGLTIGANKKTHCAACDVPLESSWWALLLIGGFFVSVILVVPSAGAVGVYIAKVVGVITIGGCSLRALKHRRAAMRSPEIANKAPNTDREDAAG